MHKNIVAQSNYLIESRNPMTLMEQRIIYAAVSGIDSRLPNNNRSYEVPVDMFQETFGNQCIKQVDDALNKLMGRQVMFKQDVMINGKKYTNHTVNWLESVSRGSNAISIRFSEGVMPFLENLAESFTKYKLGAIVSFKSAYSIKLYELLMQHRKYYKREFTLDEFREVMGVKDKYRDFKALRVRVINKAIDDINTNTDMLVAVDLVKAGRKATGIIFHIGLNKNNLSDEMIQSTIKRMKATICAFNKDLYIDGLLVQEIDEHDMIVYGDGSKEDVYAAVKRMPKFEGKDC